MLHGLPWQWGPKAAADEAGVVTGTGAVVEVVRIHPRPMGGFPVPVAVPEAEAVGFCCGGDGNSGGVGASATAAAEAAVSAHAASALAAAAMESVDELRERVSMVHSDVTGDTGGCPTGCSL